MASQGEVGGVSGNRTETPGSLGETGSADFADEPPADCRSAGFFVEVIGLHDGVVWRHGFQSMLMRDGSLTHFRETRDERCEGFSERFRPGDPAA